MTNRDHLLQAILFHDVVGKRLPSLLQLRKGLKLLGVLEVIEQNPDLLQPYFVYSEGLLCSKSLLEKLVFEESSKCLNQTTHEFFLRFIESASTATLEALLILCHGSKLLPITEITVSYSSTIGFAVSTCLLTLSIIAFATYEEFVTGINIVLTWGTFSTV